MTQLYHTFISYSREDGDFALKMTTDLRAAGVNVWLDKLDIPPGARWDRAVEDALETCGRILVILSPHSAGSENVQDEISLAFDKKKPIIPILSMPCDIPMRLRRLEYIDFTKQYDQGFQTLLTAMKLPTAAPGDNMTAERPAPAGSRPEHPAAPQRAVTSRRNLVIAVGAVVVIVFLYFVLGSGGSKDQPAPTPEKCPECFPDPAGY